MTTKEIKNLVTEVNNLIKTNQFKEIDLPALVRGLVRQEGYMVANLFILMYEKLFKLKIEL